MTPTTVRASAVDLERPSNDVGCPAETALPQPVSQHDGRRRPGLVVTCHEAASQQGGYAERIEEIGRDRRGADTLGLLAAGQVRARVRVGGQLREALCVFPVADNLAQRQMGRLDAIGRVPDHDQCLSVAVRQRLEHDRLDQAEDRRICADTQSEGCDRGKAEAG